MRLTLSGDVHPLGNFPERERPTSHAEAKSARLCLHEGVGYKYIQYIVHTSALLVARGGRSCPSLLLLQLDCVVLWCSLATVIVLFSFTIPSMYVCPRLPKIVSDLAGMRYTIGLFYFPGLSVLSHS